MNYRSLVSSLIIGFLLTIPAVSFADPPASNVSSDPATGAGTPTSGPNIGQFQDRGLFANLAGSRCLSEGECSLCDMLQVAVNVGNFMLAIAGALTLFFFIWGAWELMVSRGDEEKITSAKGTLWSALAGMVFVLIAWEIVAVVLVILTGNGNPFRGICRL